MKNAAGVSFCFVWRGLGAVNPITVSLFWTDRKRAKHGEAKDGGILIHLARSQNELLGV